MILYNSIAGRDDRRCGEIINLHIESGEHHNQTNSNSSFYSTLENLQQKMKKLMFRTPDSQISEMSSESR